MSQSQRVPVSKERQGKSAKQTPLERLINFQTKKSVHINLSKDAHAGVKIECFKRGVSMQEAFEEFAQMIAAQHADAIDILEDLAIRKRNKIVRQLSAVDAESIFDAIEMNNPLSRDKL